MIEKHVYIWYFHLCFNICLKIIQLFIFTWELDQVHVIMVPYVLSMKIEMIRGNFMKNIDKIREMNAEELAAFLSDFGTCHVCAFSESGDESCSRTKELSNIPECKEGLKKYLEAEADEPEEEEEKEAEYSEQEIYYLLKALRTLKDEASYERVFNGDDPSEEYERLQKAIYSLEDYLRKDLKLNAQISAHSNYDEHDVNICSEHCTDQLHELMEQYYAYMKEHQMNYKDTHFEKFSYRTQVAQTYWEIVKEFYLSRFYHLEEEIAGCERFIEEMKKDFKRLKESEFFEK